jgi:hypothetical protein
MRGALPMRERLPPDDGEDAVGTGREAGCEPAVGTGVGVARAAGAWILVVTDPCRITSRETFAGLRNAPRGIPSPAESLRITIRLVEGPRVGTNEFRFTTNVVRPGPVGACGIVNLDGALTSLGTRFHPAPKPPGCHTHPYGEANSHEP